MKHIMRLCFTILFACVFALHGCRPFGPPGEVEVLSPYLRAPEPVEAVDLHLQPVRWEDRPYEVVARISTDVRARQFATLAEAEAQGYEQLRRLAAGSGALAVINVEQWTTLHGEPVEVRTDQPVPVLEEYMIHMRAQGVRFRDQRR